MARVSRPDQDQKEQDPNAQPQDGDPNSQPVGAGVDAPVQAGVAPGASAAGSGTTAAAPAVHRDKFQNLSRLLYANQGQGKAVANEAIHGADTLAHDAGSQLAKAQSTYSDAVKAATPAAFDPYASFQQTDEDRANADRLYGADTWKTLVNSSPQVQAGAQAATQQTYTGPNSIEDTVGVDPAKLASSFDNANQAYNAIAQSPSRRTGGVGAFDNFLAGQEAGGDLRAARQRFQGLRDQLAGASTDTSKADAARAQVAAQAQGAQDFINNTNAVNQNALDAQQAQNNASEARVADDKNAYQQFLNNGSSFVSPMGFGVPGPDGHVILRTNGQSMQDYFNQNKDAIKKALAARSK